LVSGLPAAISTTGYNPATGVLILSGSRFALRSYRDCAAADSNSATATSIRRTSQRIINMVVNDGTGNSNTAKAIVPSGGVSTNGGPGGRPRS
jgi:hypothetical protein